MLKVQNITNEIIPSVETAVRQGVFIPKTPNDSVSIKNTVKTGLSNFFEDIGKYLSLRMLKRDNGCKRFAHEEIVSILKSLTPENEKLLNVLLQAKDESRKLRFSGSQIVDILDRTTAENISSARTLINSKIVYNGTKFDLPRVSFEEIKSMLPKIGKHNSNCVDKLVYADKIGGTSNTVMTDHFFIGNDMQKIIKTCKSPTSALHLDLLINAKNKIGEPKFSPENIYSIMPLLKTDRNIALLCDLKNNPEINGDEIANLMLLTKYHAPVDKIMTGDLKSFDAADKKNYVRFLDRVKFMLDNTYPYDNQFQGFYQRENRVVDNHEISQVIATLNNGKYPLIPQNLKDVENLKNSL